MKPLEGEVSDAAVVEAPVLLSADQVRELLGDAAAGKSDEELIDLRNQFDRMARVLCAAYCHARGQHELARRFVPAAPPPRRPRPNELRKKAAKAVTP